MQSRSPTAAPSTHSCGAATARSWAGTSAGLGRYGAKDAFTATPFKLEVAALATDSTGAVYAGGGFGLAAYRPDTDEWWWYSGESASDEDSEWGSFDPSKKSTLPDDAHVFLPAVTAVLRARDGALWIGTEHGLARYVARGEGGPVAFRTLLEAFPDVCPGRVDALVEDERGLLWACTDRGFLRYDGRDLFQFRAAGPGFVQLGRADSLYPSGAEPVARGAWRFRRAGSVWERFDATLASPSWVAVRRRARGRPPSRPCTRSRSPTASRPTSSTPGIRATSASPARRRSTRRASSCG